MVNYQIQIGKNPATDAPIIQWYFEVGNKIGDTQYAALTVEQKAVYDAFLAMVETLAV